MKRTNKDVLNSFIKQAVSYNKYLEENEMWKLKREEEQARRKEIAHRSRSPSKKRSKARSPSPSSSSNEEESKTNKPTERSKEEIDDLKAILALYKDAKEKPSEKWDHSGFMEMYPHQNQAKLSTSNVKKCKIESSSDSATDNSSDSSPENRKKKKEKKKKKKKKSSKKKKKKEKKKKD